MSQPHKITLSDLRQTIAPLVPKGINPDEVAEGVALALTPPSERMLPIFRSPLKQDVLYAWSSDDASIVKLALNVFAEVAEALLTGHASLVTLGMSVKELVCFLIDLSRHHVTVTDPLQIKILMFLRDADPGLSAGDIQKRLGGVPPLTDIEKALQCLAKTASPAGIRPLVRCDRMIWKILV